MTMKKIEFSVSMSLQGCKRIEIIEFPENTTNEELQEHFLDWQAEQLDGGWQEID